MNNNKVARHIQYHKVIYETRTQVVYKLYKKITYIRNVIKVYA